MQLKGKRKWKTCSSSLYRQEISSSTAKFKEMYQLTKHKSDVLWWARDPAGALQGWPVPSFTKLKPIATPRSWVAMVRSVVRDSDGQSSRSWEVMSWSSKPRRVSQKVRHLPVANTKSLLAKPEIFFPRLSRGWSWLWRSGWSWCCCKVGLRSTETG